jgi:hypothetical protein
MKDYYEILDFKYWMPQIQETQKVEPALPQETKNFRERASKEFYVVIFLMGLAFIFWSLAENILKFRTVLTLAGWAFALMSFALVNLHPGFKAKTE